MAETEEQKLTIKQRKWLDLYIETGNATQSAMAVYDCKDENSAAQIGWENLRKLDIRELLDKKGLSLNRLAGKIDKGLEATKVISARIVGKDANERTDDFVDVPDYAVQHKYTETALKLHGLLNQKVDATIDGKLEVTLTRES